PVSPGLVAYSSMIAFLTSASSAIGIPFPLVARRLQRDAGALFLRGRSNGNLYSLAPPRAHRSVGGAYPLTRIRVPHAKHDCDRGETSSRRLRNTCIADWSH